MLYCMIYIYIYIYTYIYMCISYIYIYIYIYVATPIRTHKGNLRILYVSSGYGMRRSMLNHCKTC